MDLFAILLLALGLSFDSFAVSISCAMHQTFWSRYRGVRFSLILGLFQGLMPLVGWFIAIEFSKIIDAYDHWIAFSLLTLLGVKMIFQSSGSSADKKRCDHFNLKNGAIMGVATSIDALLAGVALAMIDIVLVESSQLVNMLLTSVIIALITVIASIVGLYIGRFSKSKIGERAELIGGIILILLGVKLLIGHLY